MVPIICNGVEYNVDQKKNIFPFTANLENPNPLHGADGNFFKNFRIENEEIIFEICDRHNLTEKVLLEYKIFLELKEKEIEDDCLNSYRQFKNTPVTDKDFCVEDGTFTGCCIGK